MRVVLIEFNFFVLEYHQVNCAVLSLIWIHHFGSVLGSRVLLTYHLYLTCHLAEKLISRFGMTCTAISIDVWIYLNIWVHAIFKDIYILVESLIKENTRCASSSSLVWSLGVWSSCLSPNYYLTMWSISFWKRLVKYLVLSVKLFNQRL